MSVEGESTDYRRTVTSADHPRANHVADGATVTSLRQRNRALALTHILRKRQTTRAELARECGMSSASAGNMVADLIDDGLVVESGWRSSRGGRPIAVIAPNAEGAYAIGADVGERGVAVEMFDFGLHMVDREFKGGGRQETPTDIEKDLRTALAALRERNSDRWDRVIGVGLGLPGVVEVSPAGEQVLYSQSLGWDPLVIPSDLAGGLPVFAENGAKTLANAELWFGAAAGVDHALVALLGRGVGMGVVTDGRIAHGVASSAAEWGHTKVNVGGRLCRCGARGCIEAYLGADALLTAWRDLGASPEGDGWRAIGALLDAAAAGDQSASTVVEEAIEVLGAGLGSQVNMTNPSRIIIGGWVGLRLMERHALAIRDAVLANCLDRFAEQVEVRAATFGGDTVALGSALMPVEALIHGSGAQAPR